MDWCDRLHNRQSCFFRTAQGGSLPIKPLLKGTKRRLNWTRNWSGKKRSGRGTLCFEKAGIINAFYDLNTMPVVEMDDIK